MSEVAEAMLPARTQVGSHTGVVPSLTGALGDVVDTVLGGGPVDAGQPTDPPTAPSTSGQTPTSYTPEPEPDWKYEPPFGLPPRPAEPPPQPGLVTLPVVPPVVDDVVLAVEPIVAPIVGPLRPEHGGEMTAQQIVARTDAAIDTSLAAGSGGNAGPVLVATLRQNLQTDASGRTVFDHGIERIERLEQRVEARVEQQGRATALDLQQLLRLDVERRILAKAKQKSEDLLRLVTTLMTGIVPRDLVQRLAATGSAAQIATVIRETVGTGRTLSQASVQNLAGLSSIGVAVAVTPDALRHRSINAGVRERITGRAPATAV